MGTAAAAGERQTREFYRDQIKEDTCRWCGASGLKGREIKGYAHDGGWPVIGHIDRQWLYVSCRGCGYQWALWKLGVPRPE